MDFAQARTAMVDSQVRPNDVTKYSIIAALQKVERENFVPESMRMVAYADSPIALDTGRVILDARVFSKMLDALNILPTDFVLDIGCGLGYSTAVIASLSEAVIGVEDDATRVTDATENLMAAQVDNAVILEGELAKGAAKHGPYDVVIMEGAVEQVPANLIKQIKDGGRMAAIFNKNGVGIVRIGIKNGDGISWRDTFNADAPILPGFQSDKGFTFN